MSLESSKNWIWPDTKISLDDLVKHILSIRDVSDEDKFLRPSLENLPEYKFMHDTSKAAKQILKAVKSNKKIVIHGDYDADGICATSILWEFLYRDLAKHLDTKVDVVPFIPSRVDQGYGLTESSLDECIDLGANVVITVDCGIRDKELIKKYTKEKDLEFVITDHHQPPEDILEDLDYTVVHQKYPGKEYTDVEVCGAYVSFMLVQAIKDFTDMDTQINVDTHGLDLVALATVTDIMQLQGVNRTVVKYGLEQMRKGNRLGLKSLIEKAEIDITQLEAYHLGFVIGPRINAAGRIDSALEAVKLLVSQDSKLTVQLSSKLDYLNYERQKMTGEAVSDSREMVDEGKKIICIVGDDWHDGIVGLIAGKLNQEFNRPVLIATKSGGETKGSARSIKGFNITNALEDCSEYLERFGGHEMAGGFTVKEGKWDNFKECIEKIADRHITDEMLIPELNIDLYLSSNDVSLELLNILERLEPFGYGNRKPVVGLKNLIISKKQIMGKTQNHMKLVCKGDGIDLITIVMFRCDEDTQKINENDKIDIVGNITLNSWNGNESIQVIANEWKFSV